MSEALTNLITQRDAVIDRREHLRTDLRATTANEMPVDALFAAIRAFTSEIIAIDCQIIELENA